MKKRMVGPALFSVTAAAFTGAAMASGIPTASLEEVVVVGQLDQLLGAGSVRDSGNRRRRAAAIPADSAYRRTAGSGPRPGGYPAQWQRQGQSILPARLQSRPRHGSGHQRRRRAGQHADSRPWTRLHRYQFRHSGAGPVHRVPQGNLLRRNRKFLGRRRGRDALSAQARRAAGHGGGRARTNTAAA